MLPPPQSSAPNDAFAQRVSRILEDVVVRRLAGEPLSDEQIIQRNSDLMPQLAERLGELRRVEQARLRAVQSSDTACGSDALRMIRDRRLPAALPADAIPGYHIERELHRGGQGVVYLAEQLSTRRRVAIKLVRDGPFAGPRELARQQREVQILAQLRHPGIVTIHDSGTAPGGQFYFVMDYIAGPALDEYLADAAGTQTTGGAAVEGAAAAPPMRKLGERLRLFESVCQAVHAAHLRGIIHRDLKPSNIRVDAEGNPHVLDFGLARLTGADVDHDASIEALTVTGQFVGSLPWASPEQVEGSPAAIDVRTDVYSLGVMLYQMITAQFPYPVTGPLRGVQEHILHTQPVPPRSVNPAVAADLQTIVLKCLAKEPGRRYQSAGEIALELARLRRGEPIEARRDSAAYVLRKTLRRHWAVAGVAAAFLLMIAASSVALWWMYDREAEARRQAQAESQTSRRVVQFLQDMLAAADPHQARGGDVSVLQVLDQAAAHIETGLDAEPAAEAAIHRTIGRTYLSLGRHETAEHHYRRAWQLSRESVGDEHLDTFAALDGVASALEAMSRYDEAEPLFRQALEGVQRLAGPESVEVIDARHNLANLLRNQGRFTEAEPMLVEALAGSERVLGVDHPDTLITRRVLASLWQELGRLEDAEQGLRETLAAQRRTQGSDAPTTMGTAQQLAMLLRNMGRIDEAEPPFVEVVETGRRVLGERHPDTLRSFNSYARLLHAMGRHEEAEGLFRETLELQREVLGEEHKDTLITTNNLALLLVDMNRTAEAESLARRVEQAGREAFGDEHPDVLIWSNNLGNLLFRTGRFDEALACYRRVVEGRRRVLGEEHPATLRAQDSLTKCLAELERIESTTQSQP